MVRKTGVTSADGLMLIIPMTIKGYKKPKEWTALPDKTGHWTLESGDTVILGDITYEIVKSSKELQQFDDVLVISNVDTHSFGGRMAHFEVIGK
ncbi:MAG: hypothetical protein PHW03_07300 [Eubacteriales bacterium]|nr:hypothetical protein [Eubacteriales bacterium]